MQVPMNPEMAVEFYRNQAETLVKEYLLADSFIPYTSFAVGIFMCKMMYDLTQLISNYYFKGYTTLTKCQRIEWNNRGMSSCHAVYISIMSLNLVFFSDIYADDHLGPLITFRSSPLTTFTLGVSVGYFVMDLAMIYWLFPALGGVEYSFRGILLKLDSTHLYFWIVHHFLSVLAISYSMVSGEGQLYTFMVLISEVTTPLINLRWFLDTSGMKRSNTYLVNGIVMFFAWLVARILLFGYLFYHVYMHIYQVEQMHFCGYLLVFVVPAALAMMNIMWFDNNYPHHIVKKGRSKQRRGKKKFGQFGGLFFLAQKQLNGHVEMYIGLTPGTHYSLLFIEFLISSSGK